MKPDYNIVYNPIPGKALKTFTKQLSSDLIQSVGTFQVEGAVNLLFLNQSAAGNALLFTKTGPITIGPGAQFPPQGSSIFRSPNGEPNITEIPYDISAFASGESLLVVYDKYVEEDNI